MVAVVAAVGSFFAAPAVAFLGIRAAAEAGDVAGLSRLIDYDAVRAALRPQLSGRVEVMTPPPSFMQDPIGAVRRRFEQSVTPPVRNAPDPEAYLSPPAILALTRGEGRQAISSTAASWGDARDPLPRPTFWSVNRARLAVAGTDGQRTVFTFERRQAFEWKLVHIGLPADADADGLQDAVQAPGQP